MNIIGSIIELKSHNVWKNYYRNKIYKQKDVVFLKYFFGLA